MPRNEIILQAFVSSPSDIAEDREALEGIVHELNLTWSKTLGIRIELVKWETHVTPSVGKDPQAVINAQIGDEYDIFIGIMWARFGTETGRFGSGTEEEFEKAYARHKADPNSVEIMFYFKDAGVQPSDVDVDQLRRVLYFKQKLGPKGALYGTYKTQEEFAQHLRMHLSRVIQNWNAHHLPLSGGKFRTSALPVTQDNQVVTELGFAEALEISQEHFEKSTQNLYRMGAALVELTVKIEERIMAIKDSPGMPPNVRLKAIARVADLLAEDMEIFVGRMKVEIPLYSKSSKTGIESWTRAANLLTDFGESVEKGVEGALPVVRLLLNLLLQLQGQNRLFIEQIRSSPRVTSAIIKAQKHTVSIMEQLDVEVEISINLYTEVEKFLSDVLKRKK